MTRKQMLIAGLLVLAVGVLGIALYSNNTSVKKSNIQESGVSVNSGTTIKFAVGERGWSKNPISGGFFIFSEKNYAYELAEALNNRDSERIMNSYAEGNGVFVPNGVPLTVLEVDGSLRKVQVLDSQIQGSDTGWVSIEFISSEFSGD